MSLEECILLVWIVCVLSIHTADCAYATTGWQDRDRAGTDRFVGAAVEFSPYTQADPTEVLSRAEALQIVMKNVAEYEEQTKMATSGAMRASIIVFPENGLYGRGQTRASIFPYLEVLQDSSSTVCGVSGPGFEIQSQLSCLAKNYSVYVVANTGTKRDCRHSGDKNCPNDGWFHFSSNIVFGPDGKLLTVHHKRHVGSDLRFDPSPNVTHAVFETPFGRFGTLIGEDVFFNDTAVTLVENFDIDSLAFSTSMGNRLPFPVAIVLQRGFSLLMLINVVASNVNDLGANITGSGVYAINYTSIGVFTHDNTTYYMGPVPQGGKLLKAVIPCKKPRDSSLSDYRYSRNSFMEEDEWMQEGEYFNDGERSEKPQRARSDSPKDQAVSLSDEQDKPVNISIEGENYTARKLQKNIGYPNVCQRKHCCSVFYHYNQVPEGVDYYLAVHRGNHSFNGLAMEIRVCTLIKCPSNDLGSCGVNTTLPGSHFQYIQMTGSYSYLNIFILPFVVATTPEGKMDLAIHDFMYKPSNLTGVFGGFKYPLLSATMYAAYFDVY